jgi:hypothetical protein
VSDELTVPVCRVHQRQLHRSGDEAGWWRRLNIDPLPVALKLWQHTRSDHAVAPITSFHCRTADSVGVAIKNRGQWWIVIITFCILLSPRLDHGLFGELSSQRFIG